MPPKFLLDENVSDVLWNAIQSFNLLAQTPIHALRVGELPELPTGSKDPAIMIWAENNGCILVTHDKKTMLGHYAAHLQSGRHLPGLFILTTYYEAPDDIITLLSVAAQSDDPMEWQDLIQYF